MAWVTAVVWVGSLAWELPHATGMALKKKQQEGVPIVAQWVKTSTHEDAQNSDDNTFLSLTSVRPQCNETGPPPRPVPDPEGVIGLTQEPSGHQEKGRALVLPGFQTRLCFAVSPWKRSPLQEPCLSLETSGTVTPRYWQDLWFSNLRPRPHERYLESSLKMLASGVPWLRI